MGKTVLSEAIEKLEGIRQARGVAIDGKKYTMVKDRLEVFREAFSTDLGIDTDIVRMENGVVVVKATITMRGEVVAAGHGYVNMAAGNDFITNAPVEVAETSAIGRALANLGLSGEEFASATELEKVGKTPDRAFVPASNPTTAPLPEKSFPTDWFSPVPSYEYDLSEALDRLDMQFSALTSREERAKYWGFIGPFRMWLKENEPQLHETLMAMIRSITTNPGEKNG